MVIILKMLTFRQTLLNTFKDYETNFLIFNNWQFIILAYNYNFL